MFPDGSRAFDLTEPRLSWIRIDYQARLQFGEAELVIEAPFELHIAEHQHLLDPNDRAGLGPLLDLYPGTATELRMSPEGTLQAAFTSGATLVVAPHPKYEAWSLAGFWCAPGGFR